ncbi:hypothetical protein ACRRTK_019880 [Alexandromys fortis]
MGSGLCLAAYGQARAHQHASDRWPLPYQDVAVILVTLPHMASHRHNTRSPPPSRRCSRGSA